MISSHKRWTRLFLFCLGLVVASGFCMKWMEPDLWSRGEKFTIMGLELFYSRQQVEAILSGLDERVRTILRYHLSFDFAFMAGVYPCITALCMMAREKVTTVSSRKLLFVLAAIQFTAWGFDIAENYYLFDWIDDPSIGKEFTFYHLLVGAKWCIALTGVLTAVAILVVKRKRVHEI